MCRVVIGRSSIRTVAESRKVEIESLLKELFNKATEISQVCFSFFFFSMFTDNNKTINLKCVYIFIYNVCVRNRELCNGSFDFFQDHHVKQTK